MVLIGNCEVCGEKLSSIHSVFLGRNEIFLRYCDKHQDDIMASYYKKARNIEIETGFFNNPVWSSDNPEDFLNFKVRIDGVVYNDAAIDKTYFIYDSSKKTIYLNVRFKNYSYQKLVPYQSIKELNKNQNKILPKVRSLIHEDYDTIFIDLQ